MAVDTIVAFQNLLHFSTTAAVTASNTAIGYAVRHARDPNFLTAWKPPDSETVDEYLMVDGGTTTWLGAATETAWLGIAYDARLADQTKILLRYDTADSSSGSFSNTLITHTVDKTSVGVAFVSFAIPSTAKRYYRLVQLNTDGRGSGSAKTRTIKINAWALFDKDTVYQVSAPQFTSDAIGPHRWSILDRVGIERTGIGGFVSNAVGASGQGFQVTFDPASKSLWETFRDELMKQRGAHRANFMQHEGLRNPAQSNAFLCRVVSGEWNATKEQPDQYHNVAIPFETEGWN